MSAGGWRLTVRVMTPMLERVRKVDVVFGHMGLWHAETIGGLARRWKVHGLLASAGGLGGPQVPVIDMGLQVPLG